MISLNIDLVPGSVFILLSDIRHNSEIPSLLKPKFLCGSTDISSSTMANEEPPDNPDDGRGGGRQNKPPQNEGLGM